MNYRVIDKETYYRKGVFRHFTEDCKCSTSMTARVDVTGPAKVFGNSGMCGCDFCGSSGRALYQDRSGHKMTGY